MGLTREKVRFATFDCYGTLIDWEGRAASFLYELARRHEPEPPPAQELRDRWEALQFERLSGDWRSYRELLADSLRHMDVEFDGVTVAEDCRAYKPSSAPFQRALDEIDVPPQQILHVAFGFKYDIPPAQTAGMRTVWVNRRQEPAPGGAQPASSGQTSGRWLAFSHYSHRMPPSRPTGSR